MASYDSWQIQQGSCGKKMRKRVIYVGSFIYLSFVLSVSNCRKPVLRDKLSSVVLRIRRLVYIMKHLKIFPLLLLLAYLQFLALALRTSLFPAIFFSQCISPQCLQYFFYPFCQLLAFRFSYFLLFFSFAPFTFYYLIVWPHLFTKYLWVKLLLY